jgi:hypothetical protein
MVPRFGTATVLAVLLLVLFALFFFAFWYLWYRRGRLTEIRPRPLPPLDRLHAFLNRAAEMGEAVHLSPGSGVLHERNSVAETLAGLEVVDGVAHDALALGVPVHATADDAVVSLVSGNAVDRGFRAAGHPPGLAAEAEWLAQQNPVAYAAGVMNILGRPEVQGNVIVGTLGDELLLMGEVGATACKFQLFGAARPAAASLLPLVTEDFLLGEEIYAAGAYLDPRPARVVGLLAQDAIRMVILLLILFGVIFATLGVLDATLLPFFQMPVH